MSDIRADELPDGSVVANDYIAWIKCETDHWRETGDEMGWSNKFVQEALDEGAVVLRKGYPR